MDFFGLINAIRSYCDDNDISLLYGNDAYANALADDSNLNNLILIADFTAVPDITGGRVVACKYSGVLSLGRKCEDDTESSLDETPIQKYDRRLKELTTLLADAIGDISIDNELIISNLSFKYDLNKFDLNADFVAAQITLDH